MANRLAAPLNKLYHMPKQDILTTEGSHLPEAFKKFYREWKFTTPTPVHYRHATEIKWKRDENTGEVKRADDWIIPLKFPPESHAGIWGGEGVIKGFQKRTEQKQRVPHFWVPNIKHSAVYSEVLDKRMKVTLTSRTIDLIFENYGFDHYILKTNAADLQSSLALKLKKKILEALFYKTLYPDDSKKREDVYNKYKDYLKNYTEEEIEWYGLTIDEALVKMDQIQKELNKPKPLKHELRLKLIQSLSQPPEETEELEEPPKKSGWISKINPFAKNS